MPGVYLEYIKAGKFVVPVELTFQTETVAVQDDIRGLVTTSKWIEKHNWKEIKAMLKPAVEACLKYNETPLDNIPKSHHISYGENVSLGYLIVANKLSTPFLSVLDTKKNCWTDDEDDDDELLGINKEARMEDHGAAFTEFLPTKTAIRVCVVRKSVVSIDDARRIRKELGVRSEEIRNYFPSTSHLPNEPGPSSLALNQFSENNPQDNQPSNRPGNVGNDQSSDSEAENIPRTFGDPDEIRDAARIYTHVINRDIDSGEDPDDDLSLPDIEPNPPKKKKGARSRKKSSSFSPSKSKRLTHNNILAVSQEGQANFSEEDTSYKRKKSKRKRTVAVVEPMRTLPNGQLSFEHAIGALGSDKRRKARPGTSHGVDKIHSGGGRSKQPPAIDIIAPDDDRLTITNPPEPIPVAIPSTSNTSPPKETGRNPERRKFKKKKKRMNRDDDDPHKWERLTPSPLFDDDERESSVGGHITTDIESDLEMPTLTKMVDSDEEAREKEKVSVVVPNEAKEDHTPALIRQPNVQSSPDIIQIKTKAALKRMPSAEPTFPKKLSIPSKSTSDKESDPAKKSSTTQPVSLGSLRRESSLKKEEFNNRNSSPETKVRNQNDLGSHQNKEIAKSSSTTTTTRPDVTSPAFRNQKAMEIMDVAKRLIMKRTGSPDVNKALNRSGSPVQIKKRSESAEQSVKVKKKAVVSSEQSDNFKKTVTSADITATVKKTSMSSENPDQTRKTIGTANPDQTRKTIGTANPDQTRKTTGTATPDQTRKTIGTANPARKNVKTPDPDNHDKARKAIVSAGVHDRVRKSVRTPEILDKMRKTAGSPDIDDKTKKPSESHDKSGKPVTASENQDNIRKSFALPDIQERIKNAVRASQLTLKGKTPVQIEMFKKTTGSVTKPDTVTKALELLQKNSSVMKKKMLKNTTTTMAIRQPTTLAKTLPQQEKPKMGDAQTQTDDLIIVPQITKRAFSPVGISNKIVKVTKSTCDASSEEELCESPSPRSRTPVSALEISRLSTATPIHHPALGSPNRDFVDDDGLFSFESPTIPMLSSSQTSLTEELTIAPNASGSAESESSPTEIYKSPSSPQPGCSHWVTTPTRSQSPKIGLMLPPASRPPKTPRKISFDHHVDSLSGQEATFDLEESDDTLPVGSEASNVNQNVGHLFHLMNQPHVFKAGIGLIEKLTTNSVPINVVEQKLGLGESRLNEVDQFNALVPLGSKPRKRDLSPDICELVPDKRLKQVVTASRRSRRDSFDDPALSRETESDDPTQVVVLRRGNDDEASDAEAGEAGLFDYISKSRQNATNAYEPRGDEFDLSQRSYCMRNVVPQYDLKSRLYKIHSKAVRETSVPQISEHFRVIAPQLIDIFQGRLSSVRHLVYLRGYEGKRDLRSLMVALPFTSNQSNAIVQLIRDNIVHSARIEYLDYVNYVLHQEALIRIYARISDIPFENAETELRFGACYEGELSDTLTLPARE